MADGEEGGGSPTVPDQFFALRDAHRTAVIAKLEEVKAVIQQGIDAGLYRDGITVQLNDVRNVAQHHITVLSPPPPPPQ